VSYRNSQGPPKSENKSKLIQLHNRTTQSNIISHRRVTHRRVTHHRVTHHRNTHHRVTHRRVTHRRITTNEMCYNPVLYSVHLPVEEESSTGFPLWSHWRKVALHLPAVHLICQATLRAPPAMGKQPSCTTAPSGYCPLAVAPAETGPPGRVKSTPSSLCTNTTYIFVSLNPSSQGFRQVCGERLGVYRIMVHVVKRNLTLLHKL